MRASTEQEYIPSSVRSHALRVRVRSDANVELFVDLARYVAGGPGRSSWNWISHDTVRFYFIEAAHRDAFDAMLQIGRDKILR
jgi:hypothetical protein